MADYAKLRVGLTYSENSDYSNPIVDDLSTYAPTTATKVINEKLSAGTSGQAWTAAEMTACLGLTVVNTDGTNYVTVTYKTIAGSATTQTQKLVAGAFFHVADWDPSTTVTLTANTAACICKLRAIGT